MSKGQLLCAASLGALALWGADAQSAAAQTPGNEVEEVVVTGSFIAGTAKDTALPVDVIDQEAIAKRGSPTVMDMIRSLPASGAILGEANTINAAGQGLLGTSTVNLRGLGPNRTLVLLNGRRMAPYATGIVDTNLMPLAAIGRVEVLKDGAAATYGSDAIAGVVNFITRKNFDGLELRGDYSLIQGSTGDYNLAATWGKTGERYQLLLAAGYQKRSHISTRERDWALLPWAENPQGGFSGNANPGSFTRVNAAGQIIAGPVVDPQCSALGNTQVSAGSCLFTYQPFQNLVEGHERHQVFASLDYDLTDSISFHGEALYAFTDQISSQAPAYTPLQYPTGRVLNAGAPAVPNRYVVPCANPGLQDMFARNPTFAAAIGGDGCLNAAGAPAGSFVAVAGWRLQGAGGNIVTGFSKPNEREVEAYRVSGGLRGELANNLTWDVAATYMRNVTNYYSDDQLVNRVQLALAGLGGANCTGTTPGANGCQWWNPFSNGIPKNAANGVTNPQYNAAVANDPALLAWMTVPFFSRNTYEMTVLDAVLSGEMGGFELPGGAIGWAVGAQYRVNTLQNEYAFYNNLTLNPCIDSVSFPGTTCAIPQGALNFSPSSTPLDVEQKVKAVFAEFSLPVTDRLNAQLAIRYEDYGGGTGSTTNPKLAVKWQATDEFALRGSIGTTFRGPTATNVDPAKSTGLFPITAAGGTSKGVDFYGNPDLAPETAKNLNFGALFQKGPISASLDYWSFRFKDAITGLPYDAVATSVVSTPLGLANCAAPLRNLIIFDSGDVCTQGVTGGANILRVRADLINGAEVKTSGVDFDVTYRVGEVWGGDLTLNAAGTYLIDYTVGDTMFKGVLVLRGYRGDGYLNDDRGGNSLPKFKTYLRADYARGPHNIGVGLRYVASYLDNRTAIFNATSPKGKKIDETFLVDTNYRLQLDSATVTVSIENLFDSDPSFARTAYSYDTFIGNPLGRVVKVGVRKTF